MKLRTGLRSLIALLVIGIVIATALIFTCSFAGVISFSTPDSSDSALTRRSSRCWEWR